MLKGQSIVPAEQPTPVENIELEELEPLVDV